MLRTAVLRSIRPTSLLLRKQPYSKWSELDFILLDAYQIHTDEISTEHGHPLWLSRSVDPDISVLVDERIDIVSAALDEWDKKHPHDKRKPGSVRFGVPTDAQGIPLDYGGLTRERFRAEAVEHESFKGTLEELGFDPDDLDDENMPIERRKPEGGYDPSEYGDGLIHSA